jgi:hypothetical protein
LRLCSYFCTGRKTISWRANAPWFWQCICFHLIFQMLPPFTKYTPSIAFLNGGYNFNLRRSPLESTTLSHPFF